MVVYRMQHFNIYRAGTGHIVHNTKLEFEKGHTHIKSFNCAKQLIYNAYYRKRPKTHNMYLLESHKRISDDKKYVEMIDELMVRRRERKQYYININKGRVKS